jgi:hypothetical protein
MASTLKVCDPTPRPEYEIPEAAQEVYLALSSEQEKVTPDCVSE